MSVIKNYKITVKTLAPVYIGSGETIDKKEYWYDQKRKKVGILDIGKLYLGLQSKGTLERFENYMLFGKEPLEDWLKREGITQEEIEQWTRYTIGTRDAELDQNKSREILTFCKDAYGNPYIPGSSIKGSFRTMLMTAEILQNPDQYRQQRDKLINGEVNLKGSQKSILSGEEQYLKEQVFYTLNRESRNNKVVLDYMSGIRISDSIPLSKDKLTLCKKLDIPVRGREHALPIYRECLKPNTAFSFEISIDTSIWKQNKNQRAYTIEDIRKSVDLTFKHYQDVFLNKFSGRAMYPSGTFCLGGGVGYPSKTIMYSLVGSKNWEVVSKVLNAVTRKDRIKDRENRIAPRVKKCSNYAGRTYDMGICQWIRTEEIGEKLS